MWLNYFSFLEHDCDVFMLLSCLCLVDHCRGLCLNVVTLFLFLNKNFILLFLNKNSDIFSSIIVNFLVLIWVIKLRHFLLRGVGY